MDLNGWERENEEVITCMGDKERKRGYVFVCVVRESANGDCMNVWVSKERGRQKESKK